MRAVSMVVTLCALAACALVTGIDAGDLELRTDRAAYSIGDEGLLSLANRHTADVFTAMDPPFCMTFAEQRVDGGWVDLGHGDVVCRLVPGRVPAGETVAVQFVVGEPRFHAGGEYRFVVHIERRRSYMSVASNTFTVE